MTVKVSSIGLKGLEGYVVQVEVRISPGTESMVIIGLPDASLKEPRERVIATLSHFAVDLTDQKVVVNLSPAEQKKNGPLFDLDNGACHSPNILVSYSIPLKGWKGWLAEVLVDLFYPFSLQKEQVRLFKQLPFFLIPI
jgi:hypothetical protein